MADQYDAFETDERPRSTYMSRKDWKIAMIAMAVMALILWPIYDNMRKAAENHTCIENLNQIKSAMFIYMASNNDRFPPAFVEDDKREPMLFDAGARKDPYTWMSLIHGGMERRASFVCPSASADEIAYNLHPESRGQSFGSTYGMYLARAGWPQSMIQDPESAALIAETANGGARKTFDPKPYSGGVDGIVIGWDDGNEEMSRESKYVTRLAFFETATGSFKAEGPARHDHGLNMLFASGRLGKLTSGAARITRLGEQSNGLWADR